MPPDLNMGEACKYGIADGIQAMKVVRQHAVEWGVSRESRVHGILGGSDGDQRGVTRGGSGGAAGVCRSDLWSTVRRDAQDPGKSATDFHGLGAG